MSLHRTYAKRHVVRLCFPNFFRRYKYGNNFSTAYQSRQSAMAEQALNIPQAEATPANEKCYPPKITAIVDQISGLNLLEVADLNELLKTRLKISDAPVIMGGAAAPAAAPAAADEEEEPEPAVAVQTSFTLKIDKYDESKKVALIKELKSQMEGMNLVQAKKFVESCPAVLKSDIAKEDAEKLKTALEGAGASCTIV